MILSAYRIHRDIEGADLVHIVHDELICSVWDEDVAGVGAKVGEIMVGAAAEFCPDVRMGVESGV